MRSNSYSENWFSTFLHSIPPEQTAKEVAFLARHLPLPCQLLDVCCGPGRHAIPLARLGYEVTGLDNNESVIRDAERLATDLPRTVFILGDLRTEAFPPATFHAIAVLWQSFGFFSPMENRRLLEKWRETLKPGGQLILDVYHRDFFVGKDEKRDLGGILETRKLRGNQLSVRLDYSPEKYDLFNWEVFTPEELTKLAQECGFALKLACRSFNEKLPPSPKAARMQLIFTKVIN